MSQIEFRVSLHMPEGVTSEDNTPEVLEEAILQALEEAREQRQFPGVSHISVDFEDIV